MRSLQFDFQRKRAPSASGWLMLAAGVAAVAALGQVQYEFSLQQGAQAERLALLRTHGGAAGLAGNEPDEPAVVAARQLLDRSKLPWDTLFAALESADTADVALL